MTAQERDRREHRVVVTGAGVVTPVGNDVPTAWAALLAGTSGGGPITLFDATEDWPSRVACEVKDFDSGDILDRKEARRYDRFSQLGIVASAEALASAGYPGGSGVPVPERFGVIFGSGIGGISTFEEQHRIMLERGPGRVSPFFVPMFIPDIAAGLISIQFGLKGPNYATVSACASSAHAIGEAFRAIQRGDADLMLAGGTESTITPMTLAGFGAMKAMSTRNDDPETASRPFDANRDGFVIGEGAGAVVLESLDHAQARGATILAELVGYGATGDAYHITSPPPDHLGAQEAMRLALADAGADASEVDYVNAHGTSTPVNDAHETTAVKAVLGDRAREIVMGSTKSMTGHLLGAAGAVESVICTRVLQEGKIPPTINFSEADPECDLDYAHNAMVERPVGLALSNSFGFGGHNVCLALRRWDGS
ncbi:MAG TPA: beta-ketoacyl-ACP synthase II [Longimicrobiales bacterium]|nr:beta-ketoacyl-ACP synthase II [Longimicrobiales bacterium]